MMEGSKYSRFCAAIKDSIHLSSQVFQQEDQMYRWQGIHQSKNTVSAKYKQSKNHLQISRNRFYYAPNQTHRALGG